MTSGLSNHSTFLRSITTIHTQNMELVRHEQFWQELLSMWTFMPLDTNDVVHTERIQSVIARVHGHGRVQDKAQKGQLFLFEDTDRPQPNECMITVDPVTNEVTIRIFGRFLTDIQSTSEWFMHRLLDQKEHFEITSHTRCFILLDIDGQRTDLTTGRVIPLRHKLWEGFYNENVYSINITVLVVAVTLGILIFTTPASAYTSLGKFYGVSERVLSAAMMNVFLLLGQFYRYRKGRRVVEWEKP